jgi:hypothetical protein
MQKKLVEVKEAKLSFQIEAVEVDGKVFINALQLIKIIQGIYSDVPPPPPPPGK